MECPHCNQDELKPYKDFYCCYGCGEIVKHNKMGETPIFPIRLPKPIKERLRERAKEDNTTMAHVVTEALNQYLKS